MEYYEGIGCKCMARSESECACSDANWTPTEVYQLRERVSELEDWIRRYRYNIKQNLGDETQLRISRLLGDKMYIIKHKRSSETLKTASKERMLSYIASNPEDYEVTEELV